MNKSMQTKSESNIYTYYVNEAGTIKKKSLCKHLLGNTHLMEIQHRKKRSKEHIKTVVRC